MPAVRHGSRGWTNTTFPDIRNSGALCGHDPAKRICDPDDLLSFAAMQATGTELSLLAGGQGGLPEGPSEGHCPTTGYQVYAAVLRSLDARYVALFASTEEALNSFARDVGRRSKVLDGACGNSVVLAYGAEDGVIGLAGGPGVPPGIEVRGLSADDSVDDALEDAAHQVVTALGGGQPGSVRDLTYYRLGTEVDRARICLSVVAGVLGLAWVLLSICCVYDTLAHWRHRARFGSCLQKIRRVHDILMEASGDLPLCPMCIDWMPKCDDAQVYNRRLIVFLCGHRFHADCANFFFDDHPSKMGRCPICDLPHSLTCQDNVHLGEACVHETEACRAMNSIDEVKAFFLASLHTQFPDIVKEADVIRWRSCHTEIWLSELSCPWYYSIFSSPKKHRCSHTV